MNGYVDANPVDGNDAPMTEADFQALPKPDSKAYVSRRLG